MSSSNNESNAPRSLPIPIGGGRRRSGSVSDGSSTDSGSVSPASPLQTPASGTLPRIAPITPSTSPILSYFLSQSPNSKSPPAATFPFRRGMAPPVYEDEEVFEAEKPASRHARSASTAWPTGDRYAAPAVPPVGHQQDRAAGLLRRLSLGGNIARPQVPPPRPVNGSGQAQRSTTPPGMKSPSAGTPRKTRRSNTMAAGTPRPPRAPSPMGERILKGHFDGFN